jgi:hypothetical protein
MQVRGVRTLALGIPAIGFLDVEAIESQTTEINGVIEIGMFVKYSDLHATGSEWKNLFYVREELYTKHLES